jgi:hypothetical protein
MDRREGRHRGLSLGQKRNNNDLGRREEWIGMGEGFEEIGWGGRHVCHHEIRVPTVVPSPQLFIRYISP